MRQPIGNDNNNDYDDAADDDDEYFLRNGWLTKGPEPYFQSVPFSDIFTIPNLQHAGFESAQSLTSGFATWLFFNRNCN